MRKVRLWLVVCLCLVLTAPVLAVEGEREERSGWAGVVEWVWNKLFPAVRKAGARVEPNGNSFAVPPPGGDLESNELDHSEGDTGAQIEPNG